MANNLFDNIEEEKRAVEQQLLLEFVKVFDKPNFNKVAHHDLRTLNKWKMDVVDFCTVEALIFKLNNILKVILKSVCFIQYKDQDQANLMKKSLTFGIL